jgi:hypothetical protein
MIEFLHIIDIMDIPAPKKRNNEVIAGVCQLFTHILSVRDTRTGLHVITSTGKPLGGGSCWGAPLNQEGNRVGLVKRYC